MTHPRRISTRIVAETPWLRLESHEVMDDGAEAAREVTTLAFSDWVVAPARTARGEWVLVRQFRHGIEGLTLEPAGGIIDEGESPEEAAKRELLEETGYAGGTVRALGFVNPNAALSANRAHFFFVDGVEKVAEAEQRIDERTEVVLLSSDALDDELERGGVVHALAVVGLLRARGALERFEGAARLDALEAHQRRRVAALAERLRPGLTSEDLQSPHDFPELDDKDWHFEDGQLAGIQAARMALAARGSGAS